MPYHTKLDDDLKEVDVIIAGGGLAGCVVAGRLAETDKNLKILVIEQGPNNYGMKEVVYPALYPRNLFPTSKITLFWHGNRSDDLAGRAPIVPSGGTLGGGSAINWQVYTRAQRSDFDSWNAKGWSADEMLPFLKKMETYHGKGLPEHHGTSGPINVSKGTFVSHRSEDAFILAAAALGYPEVPDLQNLDANNAVERYYKYIGLNGRRQDSAHRYLHPKLQDNAGHDYPNLHVLTEKQVVRIVFEGKKAVGVEYQTNPKFMPNPEFFDTGYTSLRTVRARKLVIISAGSCASPGILERSGVGSSEVLENAGIDVVEDLPGVGEEYQDHHLSLWTYRSNLSPRECINGFSDGRWDVDEAIRTGDELLGTNAMDGQGKFRPTEEEVDYYGPEFRKAWNMAFKDKIDKPLMILALYNCYYGDHSTLPDDAEYVSQANWTGYPFSRGHIHITGKNMADPPNFETGWLRPANGVPGIVDIQKHIWAYKVSRDMWRHMPIFRGELASSHPRFAPSSAAAVLEKANGPTAKNGERIKYTREDDAAIEQKVREILSTTWHSLGTCKMAPKTRGGVVDETLSVHGLQNLKIADLSIAPENVGANTGNTAFAIGERAADLFLREMGYDPDLALKKVDSVVA